MPKLCGYSFDNVLCVAPAGHTGAHITSNETFPHGSIYFGERAHVAIAREHMGQVALYLVGDDGAALHTEPICLVHVCAPAVLSPEQLREAIENYLHIGEIAQELANLRRLLAYTQSTWPAPSDPWWKEVSIALQGTRNSR